MSLHFKLVCGIICDNNLTSQKHSRLGFLRLHFKMTGEKMSGFTKEIIIRTLFELLNEKPLAKITVKDIVERCGVNRNTFYYHFRDISDVVESALLREVDNAFEHPVEVDSMLECLEVLVNLIGENKKAMLHIYCSVQRETFTSVLDKMCQYVIKQYIVHNFEEEIMEKKI